MPADRKLRRSTEAVWPSKVLRQVPSARAQSLRVLSPEVVATAWSTGENCAAQTPLLCPLRVLTSTKSGNRHICSHQATPSCSV